MTLRLSIFHFAFCLLTSTAAYAVDTLNVSSPDPLLEDWRWTEFDRRSGLLGNIWDVFEDRDGNIWFGTSKGAQKYDGLRWSTYTTENGLPANGVQMISQTRDGAMWFITSLRGINTEPTVAATRLLEVEGKVAGNVSTHSFEGWARASGFLEAADGSIWLNLLAPTTDDTHRLRRYANGIWETVDQPARTGFDIVQDRDGAIWVGGRSVLRFDGVRWTQFDVETGMAGASTGFPVALDATSVRMFKSVSVDATGDVWVCHLGNNRAGVSRYIESNWEHHPLPSAYGAWHSADGTVWVGGSGTVSRYRDGRWHTYPQTDLPRLGTDTRGLQASDGSFWLKSRGSLFRVDLTTTATVYNHTDSLQVGPQGPDGTMWFRTQTSAVQLQNNRWIAYGPEEGFPDGRVGALGRGMDGTIWAIGIHTGKGAAARFRSERWEIFTESDGVIDTPLTLLPTRGGSIWVTGLHEGQGAVCRFSPAAGWERITSVMTGPAGVRQAYEASDGTLWFGSDVDRNQGTGIYRYDPAHQETGNPEWMHFDDKDGLTTRHVRLAPLDGGVRDFAEWPTGTLWVGMSLGLYRIDLAGLPDQRTFWQRTDEEFGIRLPKFQSLTPVGDTLWFHPYHPRNAGAIRYDGQSWQHFKQADGLPDDGIASLFRTSDGAVWFRGVTSGLSRYEARPERPGYGWTHYPSNQVPSSPSSPSGVPAISPVSQVTELRDGIFWLNAGTGVAQIKYREIEAPNTFLEPATESVASDGTILLHFSGRTRWNVTPAEDLTYSWRLNEGEWTETRNALVSLTTLDPGSHRFEVRAKAPTLRVDPTPAVHTFVVAAPWWRNPVVAGPGILLIIAVLFQSARVVRSKQQLQQSVDALSFANHELFAVNKALQRDRAVERIRGQVQSMDRAEDFEKVLSELTIDLNEVGLTFDACEIDVLDEPVDKPSVAYFEGAGFRYTTYSLDPTGQVSANSYNLAAPFPTVIQETIERFAAGEPWQALIGGKDAIVEVPASNYGRLRLTSSQRTEFTEDETEMLKEFAGAIALGYARYLDIREIQLQTERKSAFLASMSHELRTPMNAIKGFTNLVLRRGKEELSDRNQENLEKVSQASDHLLAMINDLLDLSKIEAGRMDVNVETFAVADVIRSACDTVSPLVREGVELTHEVADDIGEAHTDRARVQQMVINLLSNAIKFTDQGTVTVTAQQGEKEEERSKKGIQPSVSSVPGLSAEALGAKEGSRIPVLAISVSDTGKGIPGHELPTLFDEYRQVEGQSESDVQKGTGLGLSITKKFAELLGGSVGVESKVGKGTTFTITIPSVYSG